MTQLINKRVKRHLMPGLSLLATPACVAISHSTRRRGSPPEHHANRPNPSLWTFSLFYEKPPVASI